MRRTFIVLILFLVSFTVFSQTEDSTNVQKIDSTFNIYHPDSSLRIVNINPYFTLHVDSTLIYQLQINKNPANYFWYLKNSPVGLRINKDNGVLSFKAEKSYFLSGKLKYDVNYKVVVGVQNLSDPDQKIDTSFTIVFYNTEIIPSTVKPTVSGTILIEEGETVNFNVLCETGSFPIQNILTTTSVPIKDYSTIKACGDEFKWTPGYDVVKDGEADKQINLFFVGTTKFGVKDTATVKLLVRNALNFPLALIEYNQTVKNVERYILQLKYTFLLLDKRLKKSRTARTSFDLTSATTSLTGTILSTSSDQEQQRTGKILPSVGLALVPIKEASVPNKIVDQNQAALIRTSIKRLEYVLFDNQLIGEKDQNIIKKNIKLKEELKQIQVQLIEVPLELTNNLTEEEINRYFNSPKVNKKYRLKSR